MDSRELAERYTARLDGILSPSFRSKQIFIGGLGAGSTAVELLARCCPARIYGADLDVVEIPNLARTAYTLDDALAGRRKADALAARLAAVNPLVDFVPIARDLAEIPTHECDRLFSSVDLVIAGTDRHDAQAFLNAQAVRHGVPALFVSVHEGARGGRINWVIPGQTGCYRCIAPERYAAAVDNPAANDLPGARGSIVDSAFIDMLSLRIGLAILERAEASAMGRFFAAMDGRNDVVVRTDPMYPWGGALWQALLSDLPTSPKPYAAELGGYLCAGDALWFRVPRDPHCPVCGGLRG